MPELPLHPALVHVPLGLALTVPLLALGLAAALWRGWLPRRAWWAVVGLQALLLGSGALALRSGENEEFMVAGSVPEAAIEAHEEAAEAFLVGAGLTLALGLAVPLLKRERLALALAGATAAATCAVAGLALRVGHAGGELVYRHGAASAYVEQAARAEAGRPGRPRN